MRCSQHFYRCDACFSHSPIQSTPKAAAEIAVANGWDVHAGVDGHRHLCPQHRYPR